MEKRLYIQVTIYKTRMTNWYKLTVKKKSEMEAARDYLESNPYTYYDVEATANRHPNIQNLVKRFFKGCIFLQATEEEATAFLENAPATIQIKKENRIFQTYSRKDIENTILFLKDFEGIFTIVDVVPANTTLRQLGNLGYPQTLQGCLFKATGNTNRFYVKLAETVTVCFPVAKRMETITERRLVPQDKVIHVRWYVIRTRQEEEWQKLIGEWKEEHRDEINGKTREDCTTYIPYTFRTNALGTLVKAPIFRGLLFIQTSLGNLQSIQREKLPGLESSLMKVKNTFIQDPHTSKYVIIDEQSMTTFMFVNDNYSNLVEYESFDFKENEKVRLFRPGHPLNGETGTLQRKGKKLYIVFGLTNITGNFRIPAIEVHTTELRKVLPTDQESGRS